MNDPDVPRREADPSGRDVSPSPPPAAESGRREPISNETQQPVTLGPFTVEYLGKRMARRVLRVRVGRQVLDVFATLDGVAAKLSVTIDGRKVMRQPKRRTFRIWSKDLEVQRWVIAAAAEMDGEVPRWTVREIARNLRIARRGEMSASSVFRLIRRLAPDLARRRAECYGEDLLRRMRAPRKRPRRTPAALAAERRAVISEMKKAGLL